MLSLYSSYPVHILKLQRAFPGFIGLYQALPGLAKLHSALHRLSLAPIRILEVVFVKTQLANIPPGNKKDNITIIYTPWSNLRKDGSMAAGQVSFKDPRRVKRIMVETRENPIINRLNKTKVEKFPDLMAEKEERLKVLRVKQRKEAMARMKEEERIAKERKEMAYKRDHAYDDMFDEEALEQSSNQERGAEYWDDFM